MHDTAGRLLMRVQRSPNRLYKIELEEVKSVCLVAEISEPSWLWHSRLGHVNFHSLKLMSDKKIVEGMPKILIPNQPCEGWESSHEIPTLHKQAMGQRNDWS